MATTIADALTLLANNKAAIKQAIIDKGVAVSDNDALSTYADKIESIETGGGGGGSSDEVIEVYLDEDDVYTINCEEFQESGKEGHRVFFISEVSGEGAKVVVRRNGTTFKTISVGRTTLLFWNDTEIITWYRDSNREWF